MDHTTHFLKPRPVTEMIWILEMQPLLSCILSSYVPLHIMEISVLASWYLSNIRISFLYYRMRSSLFCGIWRPRLTLLQRFLQEYLSYHSYIG